MSPRVEARIPGIILTILGVLFCTGALSYGVVVDGRMGPGLMPMVTGLGLIVLGALIVLAERSASRSHEQATDDGVGRDDDLGGGDVAPTQADAEEARQAAGETPALAQEIRHPARPWFILGATVAALLLAPVVGLIPGLGLMAFVVLRFVESESWRLSISVTAALLFMSWLIFQQFLDVNLPWGVFGGFM